MRLFQYFIGRDLNQQPHDSYYPNGHLQLPIGYYQTIKYKSPFMDSPFTLQYFKHAPQHQEKLQSFLNLRKTQFSMRFAKNRHSKPSSVFSPDATSFPVLVNNHLRAFKSEKCVKFSEEDYSLDSPEKNPKQRSPPRRKAVREACFLQRKDERTPENLSAIFQTIKIKPAGLLKKQDERMRKTDWGFKTKRNFYRKGSLMTILQEQGSNGRGSVKRSSICGWETSLPEYCF